MPNFARPRFDWRLRNRTVALGQRTLLMGILNVTPDSFSDGGQFLDPDTALTHALTMLDDGADLLDLGGESTRPTSTPISPADEQARVLPVLSAILAARPNTILSIDTYHAETARLAVQAGAEIVNDVSGHLWDPAMSATCAALRCGNVLMHTRGRPNEWRTQSRLMPGEVLPLVLRDLEARAGAALAAGIPRGSIVLDPGFGFGKILDENYPLLVHLDQLHTLGFPILAGLSRKSFLTRRVPHSSRDVSHGTSGEANRVPGAPPSPQATVGIDSPGAPFMRSRQDAHEWDQKTAPPQERTPQPALSLPDALDPERWERELPTTVANTAAILAGAHILRVHDVRAARTTAAIADQILGRL